MILIVLQGISNGEDINSTTNKDSRNRQDHQAMSVGMMHQALRNQLLEFPSDEPGSAMPANRANQNLHSWDSSSKFQWTKAHLEDQ